LLKLAQNAAGCEDIDDEIECDGKDFGMKASSLLSNIAVVAGISGAMMMPPLGAIVDHTAHRRAAGWISAAILTIFNGIQAILNQNTLALAVILQIVGNFFFLMHNTSQYAYISDLSNETSKIASYASFFSIVLYISMLLFLIVVIFCAAIFQADVIQTAIISQVVAFLTAVYFFGYSWAYLFRECPPNSQLPEGSFLLSYGFRKVIITAGRIRSEIVSLKWFYLSVMLSEAACSAFLSIATTFMTTFMKMSSSEIGFAYLTVLLGGVPGSKIGEMITHRVNPVRSAQICLAIFILTTGIAAVTLTGPNETNKILYLCLFWGIALGWLHPTHTTILCTIMPTDGGQTEHMGLYIFSSQILSWLPPLIFTALNESGISMSVGLASLNLFFAVAMGLLFMIGPLALANEKSRLVGGDTDKLEEHDDIKDNDDLLTEMTDRSKDLIAKGRLQGETVGMPQKGSGMGLYL